MSETVLDRLILRLIQAREYNPNAGVEPVALLWPDGTSQWQPVIDRITQRLPVLRLGAYDPEAGQGPAYWVRCVVAGTIHADLAAGPPIVYLPAVARSDLRAVETCPAELAPIAELQYRSQWFSHPNGKDWTVRSLLTHADRGLGLRVADDADTSAAMLLALDRLLDIRMDRLKTQLLDGEFFRDLINPDPIRSLLLWLDDPLSFQERLDSAQWVTFRQQCVANYGFNPETDGEIVAAEKLGMRDSSWEHVWKVFAETPARYPGVPERLRQAKPMQFFLERAGTWPQDNEVGEGELRSSLLKAAILTAEGARREASRLEGEHSWRRGTVWADLDLAPLAFAVEHLSLLAEVTTQPLASADLSTLTADYADRGWRADDAALRALAAARTPGDRTAVSATVAAIYRSWLEAGALALQKQIGPMANAHTYEVGGPASNAPGTAILFVDGLRLDVSHRLTRHLEAAGLDVTATTALSALPTITETAKPALIPARPDALTAGPELAPTNAVTGTKATIQVLRSLMNENHVQVLAATESGDPSGTAWTEAGELDHHGHDLQVRLVDYLDDDVKRVASRISELIGAGWDRVEVVTDHGWLLLPGGMEKVDLPVAVTEIKKGRCARLKDGADVGVATVPWFWDQNVRIALAPGVSCFEANKEYEHGGVSPQECIVPRLVVTAGRVSAVAGGLEVTKIKWLGLLCRIEFTGSHEGVVVDLRALPGDPKTSIAEGAKETGSAGKASLMVPDEEQDGERAFVVFVDPDGRLLAQREVVVGRNR